MTDFCRFVYHTFNYTQCFTHFSHYEWKHSLFRVPNASPRWSRTWTLFKYNHMDFCLLIYSLWNGRLNLRLNGSSFKNLRNYINYN